MGHSRPCRPPPRKRIKDRAPSIVVIGSKNMRGLPAAVRLSQYKSPMACYSLPKSAKPALYLLAVFLANLALNEVVHRPRIGIVTLGTDFEVVSVPIGNVLEQ